MKVISIAALFTAPAAVSGAAYEIKTYGTAAAPATVCTGTANAVSPQFVNVGVCIRASATASYKYKVTGTMVQVDQWAASATCAATATATGNVGSLDTCNASPAPATYERFLATAKTADPAFTDVSITITGLWSSTDCTGTQLPLTPAEAVSVAGDCTPDTGGYGDQSKTVTLAGDTGFWYEVIYSSADGNKKCVGTFSNTKRYALDVCQTINAGGTLASAKFTKTAPSSDATTAMASLAGVSAVAVAAALLL